MAAAIQRLFQFQVALERAKMPPKFAYLIVSGLDLNVCYQWVYC